MHKGWHPARLAHRVVAAVTLVAFVLSAPGCSLFAPHQEVLTITATDPSAEILVDGRPVGTGVASVQVDRNRSHAIIARVGDRTGVARTGTTVSTTGILDLVGTFFFLFPIIGIAGPGFWKLEPDSITVYVPAAAR